jgi:hypothetical protein
MAEKSRRGFASMNKDKQKEIASKGGKAAHRKGTAHRFTSEEARVAGRKGGEAVSRNREHMAEIGRRGGEARSSNLSTGNETQREQRNDNVGGVNKNENMNAIELLKADHKKVRELFEEYEAHHQMNIADRIFTELQNHTRVEEEIFYPAVRQIDTVLIYQSIEEHRIVKNLIQELKEYYRGDEQFDAKMTVLKESVEHHVEEEEKEMFPKVEKSLGDQLERLGMQMKNLKDQLQLGTATRGATA